MRLFCPGLRQRDVGFVQFSIYGFFQVVNPCEHVCVRLEWIMLHIPPEEDTAFATRNEETKFSDVLLPRNVTRGIVESHAVEPQYGELEEVIPVDATPFRRW